MGVNIMCWCSCSSIHVVVSSGNALHVGSKPCLYELTALNFLTAGFQLPPGHLICILIQYYIPVLKDISEV